MALRTIADLPALDVEKLSKDTAFANNMAESIFEISYKENIDQYDSYKSRHVKFKGLSSLLLDSVINNNYDFTGDKNFYGDVAVSGEFKISGDFLLNEDLLPEECLQYRTSINTGATDINSQNILLCADYLTIYTNDGKFKTYDGTNTIAKWTNNNIILEKQLQAPNISCNTLTVQNNSTFKGNMHVKGTATFDNVIQGTAIRAQWADLAEYYESDKNYEPGTLVKFGGEKEITIADDKANAVITKQPGFILNNNDTRNGIYKGIALVGRTPVMVTGPVKKFDKLVINPEKPGVAKRLENDTETVIAIAFDDILTTETKLIECVVLLTLS